MLRERALDFIISPLMRGGGEELHTLDIGCNDYVLIGSDGHPLARACQSEMRTASDEEVLRFAFIDILIGARQNLSTLRATRFPAWRNAHSAAKSFFFLPFIKTLIGSDLLMVMPRKTAVGLIRVYPLTIIPTDTQSLSDNPKIIWHTVNHNNPLMQWLRGMIAACAQDVANSPDL